LPRLFDVFVQGRQSMDRRAGGLGLGLAIVKALVELHGGTVSASSAGENQGSTFVVRLPIAEADALINTGPAQTQLSAPTGRGGRVLVVDDNVDAAETLALLLRSAGYDVRNAGDAESALTLIESFPPALAVLDIGLPGMDGYELAAQMRKRLRNPVLKLIALTGYGRDSDLKRAMESGFDVHLVKPANPEHLLDEVARLLSADRRQKIENREPGIPERRRDRRA
jgi:CheY-like chemotaxis protein